MWWVWSVWPDLHTGLKIVPKHHFTVRGVRMETNTSFFTVQKGEMETNTSFLQCKKGRWRPAHLFTVQEGKMETKTSFLQCRKGRWRPTHLFSVWVYSKPICVSYKSSWNFYDTFRHVQYVPVPDTKVCVINVGKYKIYNCSRPYFKCYVDIEECRTLFNEQ